MFIRVGGILISHRTGWGRKLSYCIAFSVDGATDVTRRYVRDPSKYGRRQGPISEEALIETTRFIRSQRREKLSNRDKIHLIKEDLREEKELQMYVVQKLVAGLLEAPFSGVLAGGDQKILAERADGKSS